MHRAVQRALAGAVVVMAAACSDHGITGASSVTGAYVLRTVNGAPPPYTISGSGTNKVELVSDTLTLFVGGTYAQSGHLRTTTNGQVTMSERLGTGNFNLQGTSVSFTSSDGSDRRLAIGNGSSLTFVEAGVTMIYAR